MVWCLGLPGKVLVWLIGKRIYLWGFPGGASGKEPTCYKRCRFDPWFGKIPWRRAWQPTPVFLPGEPPGQKSQWATVHRVTESWTWLSTHALIANLKQKNSPLVSSRYPVYFPRPSLQVSTYWNHNDIVYHLAKFTPKSDFHRCQRNFDIYFLSSELHWFLFGSSLFNLH